MALDPPRAMNEADEARPLNQHPVRAQHCGMQFREVSLHVHPRGSRKTSGVIPIDVPGTRVGSIPNATRKSPIEKERRQPAETAASPRSLKKRRAHASPIAIANQ